MVSPTPLKGYAVAHKLANVPSTSESGKPLVKKKTRVPKPTQASMLADLLAQQSEALATQSEAFTIQLKNTSASWEKELSTVNLCLKVQEEKQPLLQLMCKTLLCGREGFLSILNFACFAFFLMLPRWRIQI
jgi:hypothetical protein